jgi:hypothetical protein
MNTEERIKILEGLVADLSHKVNLFHKTDRYDLRRTVSISADKIGLHNVEPVAQFSDTSAFAGFSAGSAPNMNGEDSTHTGNFGTKAYTFGGLVRALKLKGILAKN